MTRTLLVVGVLLLQSPGWAQPPGGDLWYTKTPHGPEGVVRSMKLIAPNVGWARRAQSVYWTSDGGVHWSYIVPPFATNESLGGVFFLDPSKGWIAISHDEPPSEEPKFELASTTDGGATWSRTTVPLRPNDYGGSADFPLRGSAGAVAFADPLHGWMNVRFAGQTMNTRWSILLQTSDGGRTWTHAAADIPEMLRAEILLVTPSEGWLYDKFDVAQGLQVTRDGARSWQEVAPEPAGFEDCEVPGLPTFEDARHGFLPVKCVPTKAWEFRRTLVLLATSDGGRTWKPDRTVANLPQQEIYNSRYSSSTVVGSDWIFAAATDDHPVLTKLGPGAGIDASAEAPALRPRYREIRELSFATSAQGWVIDQYGSLVATTDGGATWTNITPGTKPYITHP